MRRITVAAAALAGAALAISVANAGTLIPVVAVPNSTSTHAVGINDKNEITGYYTTSDGLTHGFVGTLAGSYSTFDYPTGHAEGIGINNDGYVVGLAYPSDTGVYGDSFERKPNGNIVPLTRGKKILDGFTHAITNKLKFVGQYYVQKQDDAFAYGFIGKGTKYKSDITIPQTDSTRPRGINNKGEIVGYYPDTTAHDDPGFVLKDGAATTVRFPDANAHYTFLEGVNDKGQIAGDWQNQDGTVYKAFYYDLAHNTFDMIEVPGSTVSSSSAVNNAGLATVNSDVGSFVYCPKAKACPDARGAIHVEDKWIPAREPLRWMVCKNHCMGPSRRTASRALTDRGPSLAIEPGLGLWH